MSSSIYIVSSENISKDEVVLFFKSIGVKDIEKDKLRGIAYKGDAIVWLSFLGSSVLEESDEEELEMWQRGLGKSARSFFELTIGHGEGSLELAVEIAKKCMSQWNAVVDDQYDSVFTAQSIDSILTMY